MGKSFKNLLSTQSSNRTPQWLDQDKTAVKSAVNNIIQGGDGGMEEYNPDLIGKVMQSLSYVNSKAHGSPTEIEYESIPTDLKEDLSYTANTKLNIYGSKTRENLVEEAKYMGVKLNDSELDWLEQNPGVQTNYISIKGASSSIDTEVMEATLGTIYDEINRSKTISNKQQLKTRLLNVLRVDNPDHLDYLVDSLWDDAHTQGTMGKFISGAKEYVKELFGYEDRTTAQKWKTTGIGFIDNIYREFWNGVSWVTKNVPEAMALSNPFTMPLVLRGLNSDDTDDETKDMIDSTREVLLGMGMYNTFNKAFDEAGAWLKDRADNGTVFAMDEDYKRGKRTLEDSPQGFWGEFAGGLTVEMAETLLAGEAVGEIRGGAEAVKQLGGWNKFFYTVAKNGAEGVAFSASNNAGEDMGWDVAFMEFLGLIGMGFSALGNTQPVKTFIARTASGGRKVYNKMIKTAMEGGNKWYKNAKKKVTDLIINTLPKGSSTAEEIGKSYTKELDLLSTDKRKLLSLVEGNYSSKYADDILKEVFGGTEENTRTYWGRYYSNLGGKSGKEIAELEAEWEAMQQLYRELTEKGSREYTASELEAIRHLGDNVMPTFSEKGVLLKGAEAQTFHASLEPLSQQIQTIYKDGWKAIDTKLGGIRGAIEKGSKGAVDSTEKELSNLGKDVLGEDLVSDAFGDIHDIDLQMSVLTTARNGINQKVGETRFQRVKNKGLVTLLGGGLGATLDWASDGELSTSPYLISIALLGGYGLATDPRVVTTVATLFKRMSSVELAELFKRIDEGALTTSEKVGVDAFIGDMHKVLYTDQLKWLEEKLSGRNLEKQPMPRYSKK